MALEAITTFLKSYPVWGPVIGCLGLIIFGTISFIRFKSKQSIDVMHLFHTALVDIHDLADRLKKCRGELKDLSDDINQIENNLRYLVGKLKQWEENYPPTLRQIQQVRQKVEKILYKRKEK